MENRGPTVPKAVSGGGALSGVRQHTCTTHALSDTLKERERKAKADKAEDMAGAKDRREERRRDPEKVRSTDKEKKRSGKEGI